MIRKILIVDDDADFVEACGNFLEAADYEIGVESNENEAIGKIRLLRPDLVFLDVLMQTETGGFDVADKLWRDEALRAIPVVFLTGYFRKKMLLDKELEIIRKWANVKGVLDKPVKPSTLLEMIKKIEAL